LHIQIDESETHETTMGKRKEHRHVIDETENFQFTTNGKLTRQKQIAMKWKSMQEEAAACYLTRD
jgi:hypothetical protein